MGNEEDPEQAHSTELARNIETLMISVKLVTIDHMPTCSCVIFFFFLLTTLSNPGVEIQELCDSTEPTPRACACACVYETNGKRRGGPG